MPIALAHRVTRRMAEVRKAGLFPWMRPDGKAQVTVRYEDGKPVAVDTVVLSTQHDEKVSQEEIRAAMLSCVENLGLREVDICQVSVAKAHEAGAYHLMRAENPVYLVVAKGPGAVADVDGGGARWARACRASWSAR